MEKEELIQLFDDFLNEHGQWFVFSNWLEEKEGKKPTEIGFSSDE